MTHSEQSVSLLVIEVSEEHWAYDAPSGDYLHVSQDDGGLCFVVGTAGSSEVSSHGVYVPTPVLRSLMRWIGTRS